jgi:2-polyprenyl-3-methyl-5-hydroxy-6-metoxy-1,4-benzoquinol methylase
VDSAAVSEVLAEIEPSSASATADYFTYHRRRYQFTLTKVAAAAAGRAIRVLDVGCYPYFLSSALIKLGHEVYGVASEHESTYEPNVAVLNIEKDIFPWETGFFDLVIFSEVIEHLVYSPVPALREMHRVTRPGGHIFVSTPNIASARQRLLLLKGKTVMFPLYDYFREDGAGVNPYHRHNREYTLDELEQVLTRTAWTPTDAGYFMAYGQSFKDRPGLLPAATATLKVMAHRLIPHAEDTIYALASREEAGP